MAVLTDYSKYKIEDVLAIARESGFPDGFDQWELCDESGWTVAHEAAKADNLSDDFSRWDMMDKNGKTVIGVYNESRYLEKISDFIKKTINYFDYQCTFTNPESGEVTEVDPDIVADLKGPIVLLYMHMRRMAVTMGCKDTENWLGLTLKEDEGSLLGYSVDAVDVPQFEGSYNVAYAMFLDALETANHLTPEEENRVELTKLITNNNFLEFQNAFNEEYWPGMESSVEKPS